MILRDPALTDWTPTSVTTSGPAQIALTAAISTVRYLVDPEGNLIMGSGSARHHLRMSWTIQQTDQSPAWQLVETSNPAADIAGAVEAPQGPATGSSSDPDAPPTWRRRAAGLLRRSLRH